jgi:two-component system cell cycle response regulator
VTARILVVDDVLPNLQLLEAKLRAEFYEVDLAANGPDALAKAQAWAPDVILLAVMMPDMDGFEVCRRLKADPATAPGLALTVAPLPAFAGATARRRAPSATR